MKRTLAIATLLGGCAYFDSDAGPGTTPAPDAREPPHEIPPGVWEPMPGPSIVNASLAADNGTIWWIFTRTGSSEQGVLLAATSSTGTSIVAPALVAPTSSSSYQPDVAITPSAVVAKFGGMTPMLRRYDPMGVALGDSYPLVVQNGSNALTSFAESELVPTAGGGVQFVATLGFSDAIEVVLVDVDAAGDQTSTVVLGTPDTYMSTPSSVYGLGAAALPDGSTLVAWDRAYIACTPLLPISTLSTSVTSTTVGAIQPVGDLPDLGETMPSIASSGASAYIAWQVEASSRSRIALGKFPDVGTALAEIGGADEYHYAPTIALAEPGRGAIAYRTGGYSGHLELVAFTESAATVKVSPPRAIPQVDPDASSSSLAGLVHVAGDRYVIAWIEYRDQQSRLYATEIDFGGAMMRPARAFDTNVPPAPRAVPKLPCP